MGRRVLLVSSWANTDRVLGWYLSPPMGLYRMQHWLAPEHTVDVLDPNLHEPLAYLESAGPYDVYGFSPTKDNLANDMALMRYVRRRYPQAVLVAGGPEATFNYQQLLDLRVVDTVILGEGEKALAGFLAGTPGRTLAPSCIDNPLAAATVLTPEELGRASLLDFSRFPVRAYWERNHTVVSDDPVTLNCVTLYLTSFCPHGCKFCSSTRFVRDACGPGAGVIAIPPEGVVALVERVLRALPETRTIYFHDDNACYYRDATLAWCREVAARRLPVTFVASSRIDHFDPEMLTAMRAAGFRKLSVGIEAYADRLLRRIGKGQTVRDIDAFVAMARAAGLELHVNTMLCQPEAEADDVVRTAEFCLRMLDEQGGTVIAEPYVKSYAGSWYHAHWPQVEFMEVRGPALPGVTPETFRVPWRFTPRDPAVRRLLARIDRAYAPGGECAELLRGNYIKHQATRALCELVLRGAETGVSGAPGRRLSLSLIVPALNEAPVLADVVHGLRRELEAADIDWEMLLVDDGSRDRTGALMAELAAADWRLTVITHSEPCGIGACFRDGLARARHEFVAWFPSDGENRAADLISCLRAIGDRDLVVPYIVDRGVRSRWRRGISALYQAIVKTTFRLPVRYTNANAVYRRDLFNELTFDSNGFFFQVEVLARALRRGCSFREVPVSLAPRSAGRSKALSLSSLRQVATGYLRLLHDFGSN